MVEKLLLSVLLFAACSASANIASPKPHEYGISSFVFSDSIDIISERISIDPYPETEKVGFRVEYKIETRDNALQVPLIFFAKDYVDDFEISLDGKPISYIPLTAASIAEDSLLSYYFSDKLRNLENMRGEYFYFPETSYPYTLQELKYFKLAIGKGVHIIQVNYRSALLRVPGEWVYENEFVYSLHPANKWKTFGTVQIELNTVRLGRNFQSNLGEPAFSSDLKKATWKFDKIPADFISIKWEPKLPLLSRILIFISPFGLTLLVFTSLICLHVMWMKKLRKRSLVNRGKHLLKAGSIAVPFFTLLFGMFSCYLIDYTIGENAVGFHGYTFMLFLLFPPLVVFYWIIIHYIYRKKWKVAD